MQLNNKIAIVTGGSKGIGKATAKSLIEKGCTVIITAREEKKLFQTAEEISVYSGETDPLFRAN